MSVEMWPDPNNPKIEYPIGTEGRECTFSDLFNNLVTLNYEKIRNIIVPTYGLWAGPGWEFKGHNN